MIKRLLIYCFVVSCPGLATAQHLSIAQVLEVFNASVARRGIILRANGFEYRGAYKASDVSCYRYGRIQADVFGDEYEEAINYCATGSLTYVTHSPDHATNLKVQLTRKFDFQDQGPFTTLSGRLMNLYQRRNLKVETANTKDGKQQDMWVFQFYEEASETKPTVAVQQPETVPEKPEQAGTIPLKGKYYALIIGVNEYVDRKLPDLTFPIQDAANVKQVLIGQYMFTDRNITTLNNPTRKVILRAFDELTYKLRKDDNLLIFFAGHGRQEKKSQQGYWLPSDAENDSEADWLSNSTIRDQLRRFPCQHVLVVSDACFSGELISTRGTAIEPSKAIEKLYSLRSRRAITSSGSTVVPDKSVFIDYLVKRLTENTKPYLTASELFISMREAVINNSSLKQVPMYGYIQQSGDEGGEFIFVRRPD
ncbi:caspase family protein [Spirosoma sp.]|uniref:caspase family protein n=1 Tax=Spirosoma sp. TaxID=1899569 RepID=UPI002637F118|nr:caspase family protein [Spirosoma sp.]MCX6214607.1 caspase family protein [Spirosoma sp.]